MLEVKLDPSIKPNRAVPMPSETPDTITKKRRARLNFEDGTATQLLYEGELWDTLVRLLNLGEEYMQVAESENEIRVTRKQQEEANEEEGGLSSVEASIEKRTHAANEHHSAQIGLIRQPGKPLDETQRRQIMHMFDLKDNAMSNDGNRKLTNRRIAELTNTHEKTIGRLRRERNTQGCVRTQANGQKVTVDPPLAGKQGGFRWSRMNAEQMTHCSRIAIENPQMTLTQVRDKVLEMYPGLVLSRSTVGRILNAANLQMLRAKMRDPRADGTRAHQAEKQAFLAEQQKGSEGMLGAHNMFFMDETVVPLNLTSKRAWGTKRHPAEVLHAKGKTMTIGVYAGLGLVSDSWSKWGSSDGQATQPLEHTEPRGNHLQKSEDGEWMRAQTPPRFMLFWWIRPPRRESTVLSRFLDTSDVLDPNMTWATIGEQHIRFFNDNGSVNQTQIKSFLSDTSWEEKSLDALVELLWKNNIEFRQTDDYGDLVQIVTRNKNPSHIYASEDQMRDHMRALQALVAWAFRSTVKELVSPTKVADYSRIPRFYFTTRGRQQKGGTLDSERGDRSLFLRYLRLHRDYVEQNFPENIRENLVHAWDSAPQHGKTDVTKNTKSFVHEWVQEHLKVRGAVFLPVREPDFNPVELLFAFVKGVIRRRFPRDTGDIGVDDMVDLIDAAFGEVTEEMVQGWLRYGCYRIPNDPHADSVCRNARCGYVARAPSIEALWKDIVEGWEARYMALPSDIRQDVFALHTQDAASKVKTRNLAVGRYRTAHEIFTKSQKIVQKIEWKKHSGDTILIEHGKDNAQLWEAADPQDSFVVSYADGSHTMEDNFKSVPHRELDKYIGELLKDSTGFSLLAATCKEDPGASKDLVAAITTFQEESSGLSGLLAVLKTCKSAADTIVAEIRACTDLKSPAPGDDVDLLLDMHERLFHPKLDIGVTILATGAIKSRLASDLRTQLQSYQKFQRGQVQKTVTQVKGNRVHFGSGSDSGDDNPRFYKATLTLDARKINKCGDKIEVWLRETPYHASIPESDAPGRAYGLAAVAIKAYLFESRRVRDILISTLHRYWEGRSDRERTLAFQNALTKWRRGCTGSHSCVTSGGERTRNLSGINTRADDQPPLFLVPTLRTQRLASLQMLALARGEDGERRWPGYPVEEERGRPGQVPFRTVGSDGIENSSIRPVKNIRIKKELDLTGGGGKAYDAEVTFEDGGETIHLIRYEKGSGGKFDEDLYKTTFNSIFGKGSELNANILALAQQRYKEQQQKDDHGKARQLAEASKKPILGVLNNTPVVVSKSQRPGGEKTLLVYNPELGKLHPPENISMKNVLDKLDAVDKKHFILLGKSDKRVEMTQGQLTAEDIQRLLRRYPLPAYLPDQTRVHDISPQKNKRLFRIVQSGMNNNDLSQSATPITLLFGDAEIEGVHLTTDKKLLSKAGGYIVTRKQLCEFLDTVRVSNSSTKKLDLLYKQPQPLDYDASKKVVRFTEDDTECGL